MIPTPQNRSARGLTLLELLMVIALVSILAVITVPFISKVHNMTSSAYSVSNLRQIGSAISLATVDRNGMLPGPVNSGQGTPDPFNPTLSTVAIYSQEQIETDRSKGIHLAQRLAPYIGLEGKNGQERSTPLFMYPAFSRSGYDGPAYWMAGGMHKTKGSGTASGSGGYFTHVHHPFGHPSPAASGREYTPYTLEQIFEIVQLPPAQLWAITESWRDIPGKVSSGNAWYNRIPAEPLHGGKANALFFDWHVGKIDANGPVN